VESDLYTNCESLENNDPSMEDAAGHLCVYHDCRECSRDLNTERVGTMDPCFERGFF
jgi:hypothetical protein